MTFDSFFFQMSRLTKVFGEKSYASERTDIIWNGVRDLADNWFQRTVTGLISTSKYAPLPAEILELARIEKHASGFQEKSQKGSCGICEDGLLYGFPKDNPYASAFVFKCTCPIGMAVKEKFPTWDDNGRFVLFLNSPPNGAA